jgi:hypothetical protein
MALEQADIGGLDGAAQIFGGKGRGDEKRKRGSASEQRTEVHGKSLLLRSLSGGSTSTNTGRRHLIPGRRTFLPGCDATQFYGSGSLCRLGNRASY